MEPSRSPTLPHHRHQSSLEGIIDFSSEPPLALGIRDRARRRFYRIADHFDAEGGNNANGGYDRSRLIRLTYDYARSPASQDNFLRAFFRSLELPLDREDDNDLDHLDERVRAAFFGFADYLVDNFFLPIRASTRKTPQPSPAFHSAVQRVQGGGEFAGTPDRLSALRGACLIRDHYRCVVSRKFDYGEAARRMQEAGDGARDDDGVLLTDDPGVPFETLEVAHILPHSLTRIRSGTELDPSKQAALAILNMFDDGVGHLIEGTDIDRPRNALTLTQNIHGWFGNFDIYFEPVPDAPPHTYRIQSFRPPALVRGVLPVTRTLYLKESRTIDPPSPRLLAIHSAIGHILHLSAAREYISKILDDMENARGQGVRADGSTDLGRLVHLGLWMDGAAVDAF